MRLADLRRALPVLINSQRDDSHRCLFYEILVNPPPNPLTTPFHGRRPPEVIHRMGLRSPTMFA